MLTFNRASDRVCGGGTTKFDKKLHHLYKSGMCLEFLEEHVEFHNDTKCGKQEKV